MNNNSFIADYNLRIKQLYDKQALGEIVPGLIDLHSVNFDWFYSQERKGIDPGLEEYKGDPDDYEPEYTLLGDWKEVKGSYVEDTEGKHGFSAQYIYDKLEFVIYRSKWFALGYHCSPLAPGCVDLDAEGALKGYCLPPDAITSTSIASTIKSIE